METFCKLLFSLYIISVLHDAEAELRYESELPSPMSVLGKIIYFNPLCAGYS